MSAEKCCFIQRHSWLLITSANVPNNALGRKLLKLYNRRLKNMDGWNKLLKWNSLLKCFHLTSTLSKESSQLPVKNVTCCFAMLPVCCYQTAHKESHGNLFLNCNIHHNYYHDCGKAWISVFILCWTLVYATCKACIAEKVLRTAAWPTESKAGLISQYKRLQNPEKKIWISG